MMEIRADNYLPVFGCVEEGSAPAGSCSSISVLRERDKPPHQVNLNNSGIIKSPIRWGVSRWIRTDWGRVYFCGGCSQHAAPHHMTVFSGLHNHNYCRKWRRACWWSWEGKWVKKRDRLGEVWLQSVVAVAPADIKHPPPHRPPSTHHPHLHPLHPQHPHLHRLRSLHHTLQYLDVRGHEAWYKGWPTWCWCPSWRSWRSWLQQLRHDVFYFVWEDGDSFDPEPLVFVSSICLFMEAFLAHIKAEK